MWRLVALWLLALLQLINAGEVTKEECMTLPDPVFITKPYNTTALASFQGSGNTWVRQLLALSTGYKSGDIYHSYGNDIYPEFSSCSNGSVVAVKTHRFSTNGADPFDRALIVSRNPIDALFAEFNRVFGGNKTGFAPTYHLMNEDGTTTWKWDVWLAHIAAWVDFHKFWLHEFRGPVHVIYYNNLKKDAPAEIREAIKFLGLEVDETRLDCVFKFPKDPYFKRFKSPQIDRTKLFTLANSKQNLAIETVKKVVLKKYGKEHLCYRNFDLVRKDQHTSDIKWGDDS